jgi:GcrA cell cycle regulator
VQPDHLFFPRNAWTVERENALRKLWADGLSASQIADELGGMSRSAVIGKVHRLGLSGRRTLVRKPTVQPPRFSQRKDPNDRDPLPVRGRRRMTRVDHWRASTSETATDPAITDLPPDQSDCAVAFADLRSDTCRWPMGEPNDLDTLRFCGAAPFPDKPYCARHCRIAYRPPGERRRAA